MTENPVDRAALLLGALAVLSPVFALSTSSNNNFVTVRNGGLIVLVVLGLVALAGGWLSRPPVVLAAGVGFGLAALLQLVQLGRSTNWLDGSGSTFALLLALAIGLVTVGLLGHRTRAEHQML
ncbi:hypothetical protein [Nocardioides sp.]|uniref:Rv1678 family membrane protein n=1 Tax=Nocardioides sp. TaxID=35761 RepID=UPI00356879C6